MILSFVALSEFSCCKYPSNDSLGHNCSLFFLMSFFISQTKESFVSFVFTGFLGLDIHFTHITMFSIYQKKRIGF
ncbi:hypothetical protein CANARDRAFT_140296 [[Candida] arabinofermentans NRRL YB-2248]|uniref:Uncharacterized protein n=1 Tax=[Candida] arabinofermentans NRRL YB-2248 TaxID=983967 RepID=A0A1E4T1X8_9ASCO|nr:hypothetical protein CANARDRAFT_140296 [[Candida] arabinofermentans NRRL YB-2248]